ncbi:MAG: asparagine synthase (glutamine-hydrolyzing) [Spirochaetales bacterium]|nr:asparagine synthase (glutamine-hydrolyzing) [Spirochaetales bacterium]
MCGIYGIIDREKPVDPGFLKIRNNLQKHRGPDDEGIWISGSRDTGLAHCRLSIIDLSPGGHQPMCSNDGRYAIVYNGEIYNFIELRDGLMREGFAFETTSDTEVVLKSYIRWGESCVDKFNGMFAFAIYDRGTESAGPSVFFARDRAGKKPFYYFRETNRFQFGSELKVIDKSTGPDMNAINHYLFLGYVPGDLCIASGVRKLPPAHAARLDVRTLELKVWKYWSLPHTLPEQSDDGEEIAERVYDLLIDSVRLRMISDVPVGVLLSGGLDSSLIVAAAARNTHLKLKTFTISMTGSGLDESAHAQKVADYFQTEHHVLGAGEISRSLLDELLPFIDEPIADSSIIPTYLVSKLTRSHVKVALGGDGGDELFAGYPVYTDTLADVQRFSRVPAFLFRGLGNLALLLPAGVKGRNRLASLRRGPLQQIVWGTPYFDVFLRKKMIGGKFPVQPEEYLLSYFLSGTTALDKMTRQHFHTTLVEDFLVKVDRASMAVNLEVRTPYLDYRLAEYAFSSIPDSWKIRNGQTRKIQKILAGKLLPPNLDIERKQGFSIPLDEWLRKDDCAIIRDNTASLSGIFSRQSIDRLIRGEMNGRANNARLFSLLVLAAAFKNNSWS